MTKLPACGYQVPSATRRLFLCSEPEEKSFNSCLRSRTLELLRLRWWWQNVPWVSLLWETEKMARPEGCGSGRGERTREPTTLPLKKACRPVMKQLSVGGAHWKSCDVGCRPKALTGTAQSLAQRSLGRKRRILDRNRSVGFGMQVFSLRE